MVKAKNNQIEINYQTEVKEIDVSKLKLDLNNVRFEHLPKNINDEDMDKMIWAEKSTKELYEQIKLAKGLYEDPIVDFDYTVIEGNRRLVCLRRLNEEAHKNNLPRIKEDTFSKIKCKVIPKHISPQDKQLLLATLHVKGKKEWPAFNKAKQIANLNEEFNFTYQALSKYLGMGKATLTRMIRAYKETKDYGLRFPEKNWHERYSYFDELFKRKELKEFSDIRKNVDKFYIWVHDNKFKSHRDIRLLKGVLDYEDARNALEIYDFEKALQILEKVDPSLTNKDFKKIQSVRKIIHSFSRKELIDAINDPRKIEEIKKLGNEINSFLSDIKALEKRKSD